jgi:hypothetical protein
MNMETNSLSIRILILNIVFVFSFVGLFFNCTNIFASDEGLINLEKIDDVRISDLSKYFSFMYDKQNVCPEQINLDYSGSRLVSLTVQYDKVEYIRSLKKWVDRQLPNSLITFSEVESKQGGLWRSVENSVAVQMITSADDNKLLLLIIGFRGQ